MTRRLSTLHPFSTIFFFFLLLPPPPRSTLFPYTTLFRSAFSRRRRRRRAAEHVAAATDRHEVHGVLGIGLEQFTKSQNEVVEDRKSTRLNSSHEWISYAVFCLKKKKQKQTGSTIHDSYT